MIQTKIQYDLKNAKQYFREHLGAGDYYSEGEKVTGEWFGLGAERLGLKGAVSEQAFVALCEGRHSETGLRLGQRLNSVRHEDDGPKANRRIFFDFTIAPPKSVSVVALFQDERIVALHEHAVRSAMVELEKRAEGRVRRSGENSERVTANIVAASFRHDTSRELDPHLHTHCVVLNATFDSVENRWKALHPVGMYRAHRFATNLYRHELCKGLHALGYEIQHEARGFELKGVPRSVIECFSKRHRQIDEETRQRLARGDRACNIQQLREQVAHGNRRRKRKNATADRLRDAWRQQMSPGDLAALKALQSVSPRAMERADLEEILSWADEHLFERRAVVHEHELMAAALERGRGLDFGLKVLLEAIGVRGYLREEGSDRLTSPKVLRAEFEVVLAAYDGRNRHEALSRDYRISQALSAEQAAAVGKILGSRDLITLFRGGAGTGKSFALREVEQGLLAAKRPVVVLAPQRQQAEDLQAEGLSADTLARFMERKDLPRHGVVILDEAGQVGARQMGELVRVIQANKGRLILSGDTRQHGAVAASDALRAIEKHSGLKPAIIRSIRRQDPGLGRTARERAFIRDYRKAVKLAAEGRTCESFEALDRLGCIREVSGGDRREALAAEYLGALERKERPLIVGQTREEVRQINEVVRAGLRASGLLGEGSRIATFQPVDLDEAQKRDARFYEPGQSAHFVRGYGRFKKGEIWPVLGADGHGVILEKDGIRSVMSYRYAERFVVAVGRDMELAPGDRVQLKFNDWSVEGARLSNGELVTVQELSSNGAFVVETTKGARRTLAASQRLLVRGYAVTSYGSQGKTVDTVIFSDASNWAATNARQWYVTISRGRKRVVVYTPDKEALRTAVQQSGERELAMDLKLGESVDLRPSGNSQRAAEVIERIRRGEDFLRMTTTQANQQRIQP